MVGPNLFVCPKEESTTCFHPPDLFLKSSSKLMPNIVTKTCLSFQPPCGQRKIADHQNTTIIFSNSMNFQRFFFWPYFAIPRAPRDTGRGALDRPIVSKYTYIYIYICMYVCMYVTLCNHMCIYVYIIEGSLEVKLPTIWADEKQRWEESERRQE